MKKICPICDSTLKLGNYCPDCKKIVKDPIVVNSGMYLNESHPDSNHGCEYHQIPEPDVGNSLRDGMETDHVEHRINSLQEMVHELRSVGKDDEAGGSAALWKDAEAGRGISAGKDAWDGDHDDGDDSGGEDGDDDGDDGDGNDTHYEKEGKGSSWLKRKGILAIFWFIMILALKNKGTETEKTSFNKDKFLGTFSVERNLSIPERSDESDIPERLLTEEEVAQLEDRCNIWGHSPIAEAEIKKVLDEWYSANGYLLAGETSDRYDTYQRIDGIDYYDRSNISISQWGKGDLEYERYLSFDSVTGEFHMVESYVENQEDVKNLIETLLVYFKDTLHIPEEKSGISHIDLADIQEEWSLDLDHVSVYIFKEENGYGFYMDAYD